MSVQGQMAGDTGVLSLVTHTFSAGVFVGYLSGMLPVFVAFIPSVWCLICIWESSTVQHWVRNRRMIYKAHRIARLKAREKVIMAQLDALEVIREARTIAKEKVAIAEHEAAKLVVTEDTEQKTKTHVV